jgi:hypothetical protein
VYEENGIVSLKLKTEQIPSLAEPSESLSLTRDCQGFQYPPGVRGRVSGGKGEGWDFHTLAKPLPSARVKGIYNDKNICIYHIYLLLKEYFSI